jgi:hypothetical protein
VLRAFRTALAAVSLAAAIAPMSGASGSPSGFAAHGVIAVIDTGINPYNIVFRDRSPLAYRYPGTYLPGYPKNVRALRLTLDAPSYSAALHHDCDRVWRTVKPGQLYWIPGTKIVGAISFNPPALTAMCPGAAPSLILDSAGHGTMTASRAVATGYGACPACRLVEVQAIDGFGVINAQQAMTAAEAGVAFAAANNGWIDAQSNSWSPGLPYDPTGQTGLFSGSAALARTIEAAAARMPTFFASGNGAANVEAPPPRPTAGYAHVTPHEIIVGGEDSGEMLAWPNVPVHLAADACDSWGASSTSTTESDDTTGGGTSAATPYVAAGAVADVIAARALLHDDRTGVRNGVVAQGTAPSGSGPLADGRLTVDELRRVLFRTATPRPVAERTDGPPCPTTLGPAYSSLPAQFPEYVTIGYGVVDSRARALAAKVFAGRTSLPDRTQTDAFVSGWEAAVTATYDMYTAAPSRSR